MFTPSTTTLSSLLIPETLSGLNRNVNELGVDGLIESTQVRSKDALGFSVISGEL